MPVAREHGREDGRFLVFFVRRRGADDPAGLGGASIGRGGEAQHNRGNLFPRGGEEQPPAGDQIEDFRFAPDLDRDRAERRTGECVTRRAQRVRRIAHAQQKKARRIEAEFEQARRGQFAMFERRKILPDPEQVFSPRQAKGECRGKAGPRRLVAGWSEDLMQGAALEPALEAKIGAVMAQRDPATPFLQYGSGERGSQDFYRLRMHGRI